MKIAIIGAGKDSLAVELREYCQARGKIEDKKEKDDQQCYFVDSHLSRDRVESNVYDRTYAQTVKWEPVEKPKGIGFCGNVSPDYDKETKKFVFKPEGSGWNPDMYPGMYKVISSALLLYRLLCLFKTPVASEGPQGYKCIWWVVLKHKETGELLQFGEWKGAAGVWTCFGDDKDLPESYKRDMLLLLDELTAPDCPHPYDGIIAGTVA